MGQIEMFNLLSGIIFYYQIELLALNINIWNHLTACKQIISMKFDKNNWLIELLMFNINAWNHLNVCKQIVNIKSN